MKITITIAIEHKGLTSEYGKALRTEVEPDRIDEQEFHDICDVVLYSAGGEFAPLQQNGEKVVTWRKMFQDPDNYPEEFEVAIGVRAPSYTRRDQIRQALQELIDDVDKGDDLGEAIRVQ